MGTTTRTRVGTKLMTWGGVLSLALFALYVVRGGFQFFWITFAAGAVGVGIQLYDKAVSQRNDATKSS